MTATAQRENGEGAGISGEYKRPDAKAALRIYREEIAAKEAHMATIKGDLSEPRKRIKDDCAMPRKVFDFAVRLADMEEAKRDHHLLALHEMFAELRIGLPDDLVTRASGEAGGPVIPATSRQRPNLVPVGDDFEASGEELAQQRDRPGNEPAE